MKAITKLTFATVLVIASAGCKRRETAPSPSVSATPAAMVVDPTTESPPTVNIAPNQSADAGSDAMPGSAAPATTPTVPSVDAALDGGSAAGAVNGTTNGTPTPDGF